MTDADDAAAFVRQTLLASAEVHRRAAERLAATAAEVAGRMADCLRGGGKLLFCGNGGSAADCQHLATEFASALDRDRPRPALAALALTTDTSFLTASANDFGFEQVFARQVAALGRPGDLLVAISASGNSANILGALERARASGLGTALLTGEGGGAAAALADLVLAVPSRDTQHIQEVHIALGHALCALVERALFPESGA